jgi:uncharacterized protein (UPF0303 family)
MLNTSVEVWKAAQVAVVNMSGVTALTGHVVAVEALLANFVTLA